MTEFQYAVSHSEGVNGAGQVYANPQIGVNQALYISEEIADYISSGVPAKFPVLTYSRNSSGKLAS
jgi:hypothetical protein